MDRKKELLVRVYLLTLLFVGVAFAIAYRVVKINFVEGDKWRQKNDIHIQWMPIKADRGNIFSDQGKLLATSLPYFDIAMDMTRATREMWRNERDSLAYLLSVHLDDDLSAGDWRRRLQAARDAGKQYFVIDRGLTLAQIEKIKRFPILRYGQMKGGLLTERHTRREKPFKSLASRTIGEDRDNAINVGLEGAFDQWLRGKEQQRLMKKVPPGIWVPMEESSEIKLQKGADIYTTININMQDVVHNELLSTVQQYEAEAGVAILMEVETGAIKAISNISKNSAGYYAEFYNHAVGSSTEPGSTMKLASAMALLDDGHLGLDDLVDVGYGKIKFHNKWMYDSHTHNVRYMDLRSAFEQSSNVGIASAAFANYEQTDKERDYIDKFIQFGLTEETGVEIKGEAQPLIKDPVADSEEWSGTTIPWMSHGYEMQLTPLQVLNFYNAVANDGRLVKPYLVRRIAKSGETIKAFKPTTLKSQIAKPSTIQAAQEMLRGVVLRGTAKRLHTTEFSFSGKTGTTRVEYWKEGPKKYNASFCGYFPADKPKYSLIVTIYKPEGSYYGSTVAAPVFKRIAEKCFALDHELIDHKESIGQDAYAEADLLQGDHVGYGPDFRHILAYADVEYQSTADDAWVHLKGEGSRVRFSDAEQKDSKIIPDVRGMGARDAVYLLEKAGARVKLEGTGKVRRQSIRPGTDANGQHVKIILK